jgi:hypothetical protein
MSLHYWRIGLRSHPFGGACLQDGPRAHSTLKEGGRTSSQSKAATACNIAVAVEIALALALLIGARE